MVEERWSFIPGFGARAGHSSSRISSPSVQRGDVTVMLR